MKTLKNDNGKMGELVDDVQYNLLKLNAEKANFSFAQELLARLSHLENELDVKSNLYSLTSKMDYWANGLSSDLMNLSTIVGNGGSLKQMPGLSFSSSGRLSTLASDVLMLDPSAVYEYYLETYFNVLETNEQKVIFGTAQNSGVAGWSLEMTTSNGCRIYVRDASDSLSVYTFNEEYFKIGLNIISIKFSLATKNVKANINGKLLEFTHDKNNVFELEGSSKLMIGNGNRNKSQCAVYFKMLKNSVPISELLLGANQRYSNSEFVLDSVKHDRFWQLQGVLPTQMLQDFANPYKNGYDIYWIEDALKYRRVVPVTTIAESQNPKALFENTSRNDNFKKFRRVSSSELGYHILNYIEMPDNPIFDTSNRTYWKSTIEADEYYVGNTIGKERWFHRTWLDFDWVNEHIQDAYKYLLFVQCRWQKAKGQEYVKIKIENIILFNRVEPYYTQRRDYYDTVDLGNLYQSFPLYSNDSKANIAVTNGKKVLSRDGNILKLSLDGGLTYVNTFDFSIFSPLTDIAYFAITNNGNVLLFSKKREVYYSNDNLLTVNPAGVKNLDGTDYAFHEAVNPLYPGEYFNSLNSLIETDDNVLVYGNYGNTGIYGASPINLYYSLDSGETWKVFYTFGQHPLFFDNGTAEGGSTGTELGIAGNPQIRHVHGINIGYDGNIYVSCGERPGAIMKCVYDSSGDSWTVTALLDEIGADFTRSRSIGAYEYNGYIYWGSDSIDKFTHEGVEYSAIGVYKAKVEEINDASKHILLTTPTSASTDKHCLGFVNDPKSGRVMANYSNELHFSSDYGETWEIFKNEYNLGFMIPIIWDGKNNWWCCRNTIVVQYLK